MLVAGLGFQVTLVFCFGPKPKFCSFDLDLDQAELKSLVIVGLSGPFWLIEYRTLFWGCKKRRENIKGMNIYFVMLWEIIMIML